MLDFKSHLINNFLIEAKVDEFVNRYMKGWEDHPLVQAHPEEARRRIAAAHGIGETHTENVYLTDQLLRGAYKPNEDEETMRAHVGMVRKAVKKGHMKHEDILDHSPTSLGMFFNDLEKKDPDFEIVEKPKKGNPPIANLERYKIGTVMPHPETTTKRIDKKLPMHVYHVTHEDVGASGRNPAFEFNRISRNIMQNCPKDSTICVRTSGEHLKRYSEGHGFFLYVQGGRVVRAHGYRDQGIVNHKNYPVPQEEQKHLMDATSKLLTGSKKMTYDLHTSMPPEAYADFEADGDWDAGERPDVHDPHPILKARESIQKKFAGVTPLQLKAVFSGEFKKYKKERQRGTSNPVYFPDRLAWNAPQRAEFTRKKSPFVDAVYDLLDKHFDRENPSPIKDTPFAHPDFIRHVVRHGKTDPKLIRSYIKSDNFNSDDVDHFLRKIKSSPLAQKISSGEPKNSLSSSFRGANPKHSKLFSILPSLIEEAQHRRFLTKDHIDTIFDLREKLPPKTTGSTNLLQAKQTLLRTHHPLITADHIDKYIDGFPSLHIFGRDLGAVFEHPSHTREHVDKILSGDFRAAKENKRLMGYPSFNIDLAHEAFKHSPHIREDEIVHALSGKDLSDDSDPTEPSFKSSDQHNMAVGKATGLLENPILKPHHISIAINNIDRYKSRYDGRPHSISEPIRHQNLVSHPSFNTDHEHQALATGNRKLIEHIGATTKNPDIMHRIIAMHERKPETDRHGHSRDPKTGLIIIEPHISMIGAVMRNPNIDQSHVDAAAQHPNLDKFEREYHVNNARDRLRRKTEYTSLEEPRSRKIPTYHPTTQILASGAKTRITNPPRLRVGRYGTPEWKMRMPRRFEEGFLSFGQFLLKS